MKQKKKNLVLSRKNIFWKKIDLRTTAWDLFKYFDQASGKIHENKTNMTYSVFEMVVAIWKSLLKMVVTTIWCRGWYLIESFTGNLHSVQCSLNTRSMYDKRYTVWQLHTNLKCQKFYIILTASSFASQSADGYILKIISTY